MNSYSMTTIVYANCVVRPHGSSISCPTSTIKECPTLHLRYMYPNMTQQDSIFLQNDVSELPHDALRRRRAHHEPHVDVNGEAKVGQSLE